MYSRGGKIYKYWEGEGAGSPLQIVSLCLSWQRACVYVELQTSAVKPEFAVFFVEELLDEAP
jgi:hypothetical protein